MAHHEHQDPSRATEGADRGRTAERPREIPKRGWKDILRRTKHDIRHDHVTTVAAGVAFFCLVAIVPGIAAVISTYGFIADPAQVQQQFASMRSFIPAEAYQLLSEQMQRIASSSKTAGWGALVGILLALWGGSKGVKALIDGLNITYDEEEKRGFIKLNATALLLTLAGVVGVVIVIGLIAVLPGVVKSLGLGETIAQVVSYGRWPLLFVFFLIALAVLYRYGPSRDRAQWKWISWGAVTATALWLVISALFSLYVANFGSYNKTYGSLGAIVILLMWFYLSAYALLVGAELNAEMERQTERDTTVGAPQPRGRRGAYVADNLGS